MSCYFWQPTDPRSMIFPWGKSTEVSGRHQSRAEILNMLVRKTWEQLCNRSFNSSCLFILHNPVKLEEVSRSAESLFSTFTLLEVTFKLVPVNKPLTNHPPLPACTNQYSFLSVSLFTVSSCTTGLTAFSNWTALCVHCIYKSAVSLCYGPIWLSFKVFLPDTMHCGIHTETQLQWEEGGTEGWTHIYATKKHTHSHTHA